MPTKLWQKVTKKWRVSKLPFCTPSSLGIVNFQNSGFQAFRVIMRSPSLPVQGTIKPTIQGGQIARDLEKRRISVESAFSNLREMYNEEPAEYKPTGSAVIQAEEFLTWIYDFYDARWPEPIFAVSSNGGVSIYWEKEGRKLAFRIPPSSGENSYYYTRMEGKNTPSINNPTLVQVRKAVEWVAGAV